MIELKLLHQAYKIPLYDSYFEAVKEEAESYLKFLLKEACI